jgi:iron(III) transport system substrate-binding protein
MRSSIVRTVVTASVLALAACGGSPSVTGNAPDGESATSGDEDPHAELLALTDPERRDELIARAEEEGQLSWYTSMNESVAEAVRAAFEESFDIDVELYRAGSETVLQRILQEQASGFAGNDVVETNATEMAALASEEFLVEYETGRRTAVPEGLRFDGWTASRLNVFVAAWNTDMIDAFGGPPKAWEDLADPRFDGQLALEVADYDWYMALYGYWQEQGKDDAEIDELFADMTQEGKTVKGHAVMVELLSAGQFGVVASPYTFNIDIAAKKGAPVTYEPLVEPVIARPNGVAVMKTAESPAAAFLFAEWLLEEGQTVLAEGDMTPVLPSGDDPLAGVDMITVDVEKLVKEGPRWSERYEALVSAGESVE